MISVTLPPFTPIFSSTISTTDTNFKTLKFNPTTLQKTSTSRSNYNYQTCKASANSVTDLDLYDLLGIDSSSDQSQIKLAYRGLQKRCHPDIAGPAGHDMAIILNEAYALLSDPNSRFAYDKEQAKMEELRGYTGKPMYSVWFGGESEERAVFVDEVKCVGCLKCALFAEKTFAIESVYGRARVVAQWADPEHKIQAAIETCPVDCISMVKRSNLAALEFLMSKQPRGNVRIGAGNTGGTRVSNIFVDVEKFQARFQNSMDKASKQHHSYEGSDLQREARMSAVQAIRSISNWLYWQFPVAGVRPAQTTMKLKRIPQKCSEPNINKLRDAAAARKQAIENPKPAHQIPSNSIHNRDEYWTPSRLILPNTTHIKSSTSRTPSESSPKKEMNRANKEDFVMKRNAQTNPFVWGVPMGMATIAAAIVRSQVGEGVVGAGIEEHMGGSLALDIVNSSWLQFILAAIPWYIISMAVVGLINAIRSKLSMYEK